MLDMGFIPDIEKICKLLPAKRQTLFFSATMPPEIQRLVDSFLKEPARIEVAKPATTVKTITQRFMFCRDGEDWAKREALRELMRGQDVRNAIVFCNRKRDVAILHKSLLKHGFNAGALHGDMDQKSRMETLDAFRAGRINVLAASDVAARGLDIPEVSHVFNFDVPWVGDDYVHRIGRTGRAGREGFSATLVTPDELRLVKDIERVTGETPTWLGDPPTPQDIAEGSRRRGRRRPAAGAGRPSERRLSATSRPARSRRPAASSAASQIDGETAAARPARGQRPAAEASPKPRQSPAETRRHKPPAEAAPAEKRTETRAAAKRDTRAAKERRPETAGVGFADKVPAFMRKPARAAKAANE